MSIVEVKDLKTYFPIKKGVFQKTVDHVKAVDGVSLNINAGEVYSLVGESGSGKSTLGYSMLGLTDITSGDVLYDNKIVDYKNNSKAFDAYRKDYNIIFQSPYHSLNPRNTIYEILSAPLLQHGTAPSEVKDRCAEVLKKVELDPDTLMRFPHAFSGGQRQRINIARTIALNPKFIVCDEVVSALDVRVQATILNLLMQLKEDLNLSLLFISHDMGVVEDISDRIGVMYKGTLVEEAGTSELFNSPKEAYTQQLIEAVPKIDKSKRRRK